MLPWDSVAMRWCFGLCSVPAMKSALRSFMFLCAATALCLENGCSHQPLKDRISNAPRREDRRTLVERESQERQMSQIVKGLQRAGDPDARGVGRPGMMYYILFLIIGAAVIAGLVYWNLWRLKRMEWALTDPIALLQELYFVHQISEPEKRLMREVSERNALANPLQLFVEPKFFLEALEKDSFVSYRSALRRLLSKLFDIIIEAGDEASAVLPPAGMASAVMSGVNSETKVFSGGNPNFSSAKSVQ